MTSKYSDKKLYVLNAVVNILTDENIMNIFINRCFSYFMKKKINYNLTYDEKEEINKNILNYGVVTINDFYTLLEEVLKTKKDLEIFIGANTMPVFSKTNIVEVI